MRPKPRWRPSEADMVAIEKSGKPELCLCGETLEFRLGLSKRARRPVVALRRDGTYVDGQPGLDL